MGIDSGIRRAVFLDRDGVVNRAEVRDGRPYPPSTAEEVAILPGVAEALARFKSAGLAVIVVTNQPDVARGTQSREAVEAIHAKLAAVLPIDEFRVCYHDDRDECSCRKPKPGLILDAARARALDLGASVMVGDRWRDVEAGERAGCRTVFLDYGYADRRPIGPDLVVRSLSDATDWILAPPETLANDIH
jgi:D-glycero-D-manno-heptose 1,7-bisphosphate phosphatase